MRLYEYISNKDEVMDRANDPDLDRALTMLEKDCQKFIKETGGFLFRATDRRLGDVIKKMKQREDRRPLNTKKYIHALADTAFQKSFGWKARTDALFTSTHPSQTRGYGSNMYLVFPIGNYKYIWSDEISDFFIKQSGMESVKQRVYPYTAKLDQDDMDSLMPEYTDKNLKKAWADRESREVMLNCPNGYYYVNTLMIGELSHYLNIER